MCSCDQKKTVESLWTLWDNYPLACVLKVHKSLVVHTQKKVIRSYTQVIQAQYTVLMNTFFTHFTSLEQALYTVSTQPIKTIYLNKGVI
jgi:hypothetical protein